MNEADAPADAGDGSWMTYGQLAEARQIGRRAAVRLAQRYHLRRQPGNDGSVRVWVPSNMAASSPFRPHPPATPEADADDTPAADAAPFHAKALAALEEALRSADARTDAALALVGKLAAEVADAGDRLTAALAATEQAHTATREAQDAAKALREQLGQANARADRAETRVDDLRAQIDVLNAEMSGVRAEADRALAEERLRADRLSDQVEAGHRDLDAARAEAAAMRGQVEVAEWRADAADTDRRVTQARLEHAEAGREGERARADALRDRLTTMQEQLADAHAALQAAESADVRAVRAEQDKERAEASRDTERQRADRAEQGREADRARADVLQAKLNDVQVQLTARQEVIDAAEAIRKADDARLARGRWARLRAAWRGK